MLSKDPVKRGLNPYPYCDNDPANYTDPTGEVANILAGGIVGGTIGFAWGFAGSAISQRMSGRRVDWRRAAGAGINGAVIGAVRGAMTASGVGAAAAFAGNFAAGTAGSALEQWIGTGNVSARRSVAGGLINAVNNAVYKDYVFKSGTQALKKGFLAGGARAGIEYLSETLGKPSKYDRNRRSTRRSYMPESRDLRISCGRPDPLGKSLGYSSARGYQYKNPQTNRGFRLGEFIGTVMRGGLMEGLNNLMFFEAGKAVEALGVSVSPHEGENTPETSRVGRWMSKDEYNKMVETKHVQKPYNADQSYVANPADFNAYYKQASKGSVYVEFDVPSSSLKQTKDVWAAIPGPNSIYSKLNILKGLKPYDFPKATNIRLVGVK